MDKFDKAILEALQTDASISINELAECVGLTSTPCWRRVQGLETRGVIQKRVALLSPELLNVGVTVFVSIRTSQHNAKWLLAFHKLVTTIPEVMDCYRMSGQTDYMLRVVVPDIGAYDRVYKSLIKDMEFLDINSSFAMERIKSTTKLPLSYAL